MEYVSAIVDECGDVVMLCDKLTRREISRILNNHPEWSVSCVPV